MDVLSDKIVRARKDYFCDACEAWNRDPPPDAEMDTEDVEEVARAEADDWKIKSGQEYRKIVSVCAGKFSVYRARPGIDGLCDYYDMFSE